MSVMLEEALEYCRPFATDQGEAVLGYGHIQDNRVTAGDYRNCIECRFYDPFNKEDERLVSLTKEAETTSADVSECAKLERDLILRDTDQYAGSCVIQGKPIGLGKVFEAWKNAFSFSKKNFGKKGTAYCLLEINVRGIYLYSIGERGVNAKIELCVPRDMKPLRCGSFHSVFDTERLIHICNVFAKTNPESVYLYTDAIRERILIEADDVRCLISTIKIADSVEIKCFYECERKSF